VEKQEVQQEVQQEIEMVQFLQEHRLQGLAYLGNFHLSNKLLHT